jgi:hypothetical protein
VGFSQLPGGDLVAKGLRLRRFLRNLAREADAGAAACLVVAALAFPARGAGAEGVEIAPFVGVQNAGSVESPSTGASVAIGSDLDFGGTVDVPVAPSWRIEALYSRQQSQVASGGTEPPFDLAVERYMAGIQEQAGEGSTRFFGVFLLGLTRFVPGATGYGADERFTLGLSLGLKTYLSRRFGFRVEARGFFVAVEGGAGAVCSNGSCLFRYRASGLWQGDLTGGVVVAF